MGRPLYDLGLLESGQPFRRLLCTRGNVEPELGKALLKSRIGQRLTVAAWSLAMISFGVPFGAQKPNQPDI